MAFSDSLAEMLAVIRNGQQAGLATVSCKSSSQRKNVLEVLKREGYINEFSEEKNEAGFAVIKIELKYFEGKPVIKVIRRVSKPGRRVYKSIKDLPKFYNGLGISIVSTSKGVMSDYEAQIANVGGEVLCNVF